MSPEQVNHQPIDRRVDVFAAGIVLHELLTGKRLFAAQTELETLQRVSAAKVVAPSVDNREVPRALDAIVKKALARDPGERYASGGALAEALESLDALAWSRRKLAAFVAELFANDWMVVCEVCGKQVLPGADCGECGTAAPETEAPVALDPEAEARAVLGAPGAPSAASRPARTPTARAAARARAAGAAGGRLRAAAAAAAAPGVAPRPRSRSCRWCARRCRRRSSRRRRRCRRPPAETLSPPVDAHRRDARCPRSSTRSGSAARPPANRGCRHVAAAAIRRCCRRPVRRGCSSCRRRSRRRCRRRRRSSTPRPAGPQPLFVGADDGERAAGAAAAPGLVHQRSRRLIGLVRAGAGARGEPVAGAERERAGGGAPAPRRKRARRPRRTRRAGADGAGADDAGGRRAGPASPSRRPSRASRRRLFVAMHVAAGRTRRRAPPRVSRPAPSRRRRRRPSPSAPSKRAASSTRSRGSNNRARTRSPARSSPPWRRRRRPTTSAPPPRTSRRAAPSSTVGQLRAGARRVQRRLRGLSAARASS